MKFKQRFNEMSIVKPSGFVGIISQNSNLVVEKSFIEKGTSFINAFDNSNVVLKDCGSPYPSYVLNENFFKARKSKIKSEIDTVTLPPWVHYKLARFDGLAGLTYSNKIENYPGLESSYYFYLGSFEDSEIHDDVKTAYSELERSIRNDNSITYDKLLDNQLTVSGLSTADYGVTQSGTYFLTDIDSSIKQVWPLVSGFNQKEDLPELALHLKERNFYDLKYNNKEIDVRGIVKTDNTGNIIYTGHETDKRDSNTYNKIISGTSTNAIIFNMNLDDAAEALIPFEYENGRKYIDGPYLMYSSLSSTYTIQVKSGDVNNSDAITIRNTTATEVDQDGKIWKQGNEHTYWFTYQNTKYSLFNVINGWQKLPNSFLDAYENVDTDSKNIRGIYKIMKQSAEDRNYIYDELGFKAKTTSTNVNKYIYFANTDVTDSILGFTPAQDLSKDWKDVKVTGRPNSDVLLSSKFKYLYPAEDINGLIDVAYRREGNAYRPSAEYSVSAFWGNEGYTIKKGYDPSKSIFLPISDYNKTIKRYLSEVPSEEAVVTISKKVANPFATSPSPITQATITVEFPEGEGSISRTFTFDYFKVEIESAGNEVEGSSTYPLSSVIKAQHLKTLKEYNLITRTFSGNSFADEDLETYTNSGSNYFLIKDNKSFSSSESDSTWYVISGSSQDISSVLSTSACFDLSGSEIEDNEKITYKFSSVVKASINGKEQFTDTELRSNQVVLSIKVPSAAVESLYDTYAGYYYEDAASGEILATKIKEFAETSLDSYLSSLIDYKVPDDKLISFKNEYNISFQNDFDEEIEKIKRDLLSSNLTTPIGIKNVGLNTQNIILSEGDVSTIKVGVDQDLNGRWCIVVSPSSMTLSGNEYNYEEDDTAAFNYVSEIKVQEKSSGETVDIEDLRNINDRALSSLLSAQTVDRIKKKNNDKLYLLDDFVNEHGSEIVTITENIPGSSILLEKTRRELSPYEASCLDPKYGNLIYVESDNAGSYYKLTGKLSGDASGNAAVSGMIGNAVVYPLYLNNTPLTGANPTITISDFTYKLDVEGFKEKSAENIPLFYDENLRYPLAVRQKIRGTGDDPISGVIKDGRVAISDSNLPVAYGPSYVMDRETELENAYGWLNVDKYLDYSSINSDYLKSGNSNRVTSLTLKGIRFDKDGAHPQSGNNDSYLALSGQNRSSFVAKLDSVGNVSATLTPSEYNVSKFFENEPDISGAFRELSFNFKIPEESWETFDDIMYRENDNYNKPYRDAEKQTYKDGDELTTASGYFTAIYRQLKDGVTQESTTSDENIYLPIGSLYTISSYQEEVTFKISDADVTSSLSAKMFACSSPNNTLNFNGYLFKEGDNKVWSNYITLKYLDIPIEIHLKDGVLKPTVQLNDIIAYVKYSEDVVNGKDEKNLFISFISDDENMRYAYKSADILGDKPAKIDYTFKNNLLLNEDLINYARTPISSWLNSEKGVFDPKFDEERREYNKLGIITEKFIYDEADAAALSTRLEELSTYISGVEVSQFKPTEFSDDIFRLEYWDYFYGNSFGYYDEQGYR